MLRFVLFVVTGMVVLGTPAPLYATTESEIASRVPAPLRAIYETRQFSPLWLEDDKPSARVEHVFAALEQAPADGLRVADYGLGSLREQRDALVQHPGNEQQQALFDLAVSNALVHFAGDLAVGRVDPGELGLSLDVTARRVFLRQHLERLLTAEPLEPVLADLRSPMPAYLALRTALVSYRELASAHPDVPDLAALPGKKLEPGQHWPGCPALARWLGVLGDMTPDTWPQDQTRYSDQLVDAVKHFQARHGLETDGVLGQQTLQALLVPLPQRVLQIELTMERLRWIDAAVLEQRFILVNIPHFQLSAFDLAAAGPKPVLEMAVVVGKAGRNETPLLAKHVSHVIFSPYWNVPRSITTKEIIPKWRKDPHYLTDENMELVAADGHVYGGSIGPEQINDLIQGSYRLRQRPGKHNALGGLKFMFPNDDSIYMHDTPQQRLFAKDRRDFSHGCIRLANPMGMAMFALEPQGGWNEEQIQAQIDTGREKHLLLKESIPILVTYLTAVVREDGSVAFLRDVYHQDEELATALAMHR